MSNETYPIGTTRAEIFKVLDGINEARNNGKLHSPFDPEEIIGEHPSEEVPGIRSIEVSRKEDPKGLLETNIEAIKNFVGKHGKVAMVVGGITIIGATAAATLLIGHEIHLRHLKKDK
ncbi:MAG: hypothetical protein Q7S38_00430 [bacterium]|nr:hypothetical protein [bacterium]